jgi:hypothetical protein
MPENWYPEGNHPGYHHLGSEGGTRPLKRGAGGTTRPPVPERVPPACGDQLALLDPLDDGRSWDEWFRSLPLKPEGR